MDSEARSERIEEATRHSDLGLQSAFKGVLRLPRRLMARVLWPLLREQIEFNHRVIELLRALSEEGAFFRRAYENFEQAFDNVDNAFSGIQDQTALLNERLELVRHQAFVRYHEGVGQLQSELADTTQFVERQFAATNELVAATNELVAATNETMERAIRGSVDKVRQLQDALELGLADLRLRVGEVDLFLNAVRRSLPNLPEPQQLAELPSALANLYPSLELALRGTEESIKERERGYLQDVAKGKGQGPLLDLGCGRCEWLELLRDAGVDAYGIEINQQFVESGKARGLDVRHADVLQHLKGLPESSVGAITAFHLVEHLETEALLEMMDLSLRALQPGGLLVLETPNPDNLVVGASSFYLDPTHLHPLPPLLLSFLVGARGFTKVEVRAFKRGDPLEPSISPDAPWAGDVGRIWSFLSARITGPEDYAVLARRA